MDNVKIGFWGSKVESLYESVRLDIAVPGSLEFVGLTDPIKQLFDRKLSVYEDPFDGMFIPDLFPDLNDNERLDVLVNSDPVVLGFAASMVHYYRRGNVGLQGGGWESNGMGEAGRAATCYDHNPFSSNLTKDISEWWDYSNCASRDQLVLMQLIKPRILTELSQKVNEGFSFGEPVKDFYDRFSSFIVRENRIHEDRCKDAYQVKRAELQEKCPWSLHFENNARP